MCSKKRETTESVFKKKVETTESVTEKYFFFLMPKATREIKKKGEGTTEVCSKKGSREPGELKKSEGVFKKGETTGRTKKERGECFLFFEKYIYFFFEWRRQPVN